jgi:hypothetical protein
MCVCTHVCVDVLTHVVLLHAYSVSAYQNALVGHSVQSRAYVFTYVCVHKHALTLVAALRTWS